MAHINSTKSSNSNLRVVFWSPVVLDPSASRHDEGTISATLLPLGIILRKKGPTSSIIHHDAERRAGHHSELITRVLNHQPHKGYLTS